MFIENKGLRLNVKVTGVDHKIAPPVLLLHALGTDLQVWDRVLALLPDHLRYIRFDQRGHGRSDAPPAPYAMGALVADAEAVLDALAVRDCMVIGLSMGGLVAQGLAVKRLDLVRGLVLSGTAARIGSPEMWHRRIDEVRQTGLDAYAAGAMQRILGPRYQSHPDHPYLHDLLIRTDPDGWAGCAAAIAGTDFYTTTASLRLPTLAIAGANDSTTPPDLVRETAELIPGHRFALMRGVGHLPMVEKPAEFAALVETFLMEIGHG